MADQVGDRELSSAVVERVELRVALQLAIDQAVVHHPAQF
jgi:hypothetical protein